MTERQRTFDPIAAVAAIQEPTRRRLYELVIEREAGISRDEAADALGIGRPIVAFHLDRLARVGLVTTAYRRMSGRTGPGAGRPAKIYRRAPTTVAVSLPERRYEVAAELFASALEAGDPAGILEAAGARGRALGDDARVGLGPDPSGERRDAALLETLRQAGYEPRLEGGAILLRNCPFDALVSAHRGLTCGMNLAMLEGIRDGVGETTRAPRPVEIPGYCCAAFLPDVAEGDEGDATLGTASAD